MLKILKSLPPDLMPYYIRATDNPSMANRYTKKDHILKKYGHHSAIDTKELNHHRDANPIDDIFNMDEYKDYGADKLGNDMNYTNNRAKQKIFKNKLNGAFSNN